jgi:hypothetical protein
LTVRDHPSNIRAPVRERRLRLQSLRTQLLALVVLGVVLQIVRAWGQLRSPLRPLPPNDSVSRYWQRFAGVRAALDDESARAPAAPWQRLGYLGDAPTFEQLPHLGRDEMTALFLAQRALLPHLLVYGTDEPRILGNFHGESSRRERPARAGLEVERDFGDGVLLLRRRP